MKAKLILIDSPIIVSDEEIKTNELGHCDGIIQPFRLRWDNKYWLKLIASDNPKHNLPTIDYNGLEEEFGIIDVEKLAVNQYNNVGYNKEDPQDLYVSGVKFGHSINDKKFSLEDMINCYEGVLQNVGTSIKQSDLPTAEEYIKSLQQPKVFYIEVESYRPTLYTSYGLDYQGDLQPKITNNSIKIIKKL